VIMGRTTPGGPELLKKIEPLEEFHRNLLGRMSERQRDSLIGLLAVARGLVGDGTNHTP